MLIVNLYLVPKLVPFLYIHEKHHFFKDCAIQESVQK